MKLKIYSFYSRLISFCLVLLGFGSCAGWVDPVDEYGSPSAKYKVIGKVVSSDEEKTPIKNIRVVITEDMDESKYSYLTGDTVFTNAEGKFEVIRSNFAYNKLKLKLQDVDGETNKQFEDQIQKIEFQDADFKGGSSWYRGQAEKDLGTIEMTPKGKTE